MVRPPLKVGVVDGGLADCRATAWEGWGQGGQIGGVASGRKRRCGYRDPIFMQMLVLWEEALPGRVGTQSPRLHPSELLLS